MDLRKKMQAERAWKLIQMAKMITATFITSALKLEKQMCDLLSWVDWCLASKRRTNVRRREQMYAESVLMSTHVLASPKVYVPFLRIPISSSQAMINLKRNKNFFRDKRRCSQALRHEFWKLYRLCENIKSIYYFCQCKSHSSISSWALYSLANIFQWPGPRQFGRRYVL